MSTPGAPTNEPFRLAWLTTFRRAWGDALEDRIFRLKLLLIPGIFIAYSAITQPLADYIEQRRGISLDDRLLTYVPIADCSVGIFLLLYCSMITVFVTHLTKPRVIMRILGMHLVVAVVRQLCILIIPLEPPAGILLLKDVFLENTIYPHHLPMTKDLFFSGHVASIWIYCLCTQHRYQKICFGCATVVMSLMVLSMRVHYSYDVYGAIFFTTVIYSTTQANAVVGLRRRLKKQLLSVNSKK